MRAVADDQVLAVLTAPSFTARWLFGFSPNSRYLRARYWREPEGLTDWVWDIDQQRAVLKELRGDAWEDFSSDSRWLARCQSDNMLSVYDLGSGKELKRFPGTRQFNHVILSPGNTRLACSSGEDPMVEIRDAESGRNIRTLACPSGVSALAWSGDGKRLATACYDYHIYVWDAENGQQKAALDGHDIDILSVAFNYEGNLLASSSFDGVIRLWNPDGGRQIASYPGSSWQLQFSPDDLELLGWQNVARFGSLQVVYSQECRLLYADRSGGSSIPEFSPDGRILAVASGDRVRFWDVHSGKEIGSFRLASCEVHFHPDGRTLIVIDSVGGVRLRSLEWVGGSGSSALRLGTPRPFFDTNSLAQSALSVDGRHLGVTHESEGECFIFDLRDPSTKAIVLRPHPMVDRIAISPDNRWAATASWHNSMVKVWNALSGELVRTLTVPGRATVAFSPDGRWLATSTREYQLWEVGSWRPKGPPTPGLGYAEWNFTAFSPDGRVMARKTEGHYIQLLEASTAKPLATLEAPGSIGVSAFRFSSDGSLLAAVQHDQRVQLWDLRLIRQELAEMHLDWDLPPYPPVDSGAVTGPVTLEIEPDPSSPAPTK